MIAKNLKSSKLYTTFMCHLRFSTVIPGLMLILLVHAVTEPIKLHPIGDSTTNASLTEHAWRYFLYKLIVEGGCDSIDFVGSINGPTKGNLIKDNDWDKDHDGHTSSKASQILDGPLARGHKGHLREWAPKFKSHIAVIHLATNDIRGRRKTADIIKSFEGIIQVLRDAREEVKIVVCQIPYWNWGRGGSKDAVDAFNAGILALKDLGTEISPIKIVDINTGYELKDHRDGLHPGPSGAELIGDRVYEAIAPWLKIEPPVNLARNSSYEPNRTTLKKGLRLGILDNAPARVWIPVEPGFDFREGRGFLITGKMITVQ